ncbi:MAG TPA: hypothetical protein VII87_07495, partial [Solirubrobacteraceae bacterium]
MDDLRRACAIVSGRTRHVLVATQLIADYAAALPLEPPAPATQLTSVAERERAAAHLLQLDAVNFGSGWFPTLRKPGGRSGYRTIV